MLDRQRGLLQQLEKSGSPAWDRQEKLEILSAVAFQAHVGAGGSTDRAEPNDRRFVWRRQELEEAVRNAILYGGDRLRTIHPDHASLLTAYFLARTGLLIETREGHYQFGHLSFQEYLTALFLLNLASAGTDKVDVFRNELLSRLGQPGWLEVALLALAIDSSRSGGKGHPPILGDLDLAAPAHFSLLSAVLAGEELRLTLEERRAWLLVWVAYDGARSEHVEIVASLPANHEALEDAWRATCQALAESRSLPAALQALAKNLEKPDQPSNLTSSTLGQLLGFRQDSAVAIPIGKLAGANFPVEATEEAAAAILRLPLLSSAYPEGVGEQLLPVVQAMDLFAGQLPSPIWFALDDLTLAFPEIEAPLAARGKSPAGAS